MKKELKVLTGLLIVSLLWAGAAFAQKGETPQGAKAEQAVYCVIDDKKIEKKDAIEVKYKDEVYYVHSQEEKKKFEKAPEKHVVAWDPVCEMKVNKSGGGHRAMETVEYEGQRYYLCAKGEKEKFLANPQKYLKKMKKM